MKKELKISLLAAIDQINAKAHYLSADRGAEGDPHLVMPEIIEEENEDIVGRSISEAMARLREAVRIHVPVSIDRHKDADAGEDTLSVQMTLPGNYDTSALPTLEDAITGYIASSAMYDWLSGFRPAEAEPYAQHIASYAADIRNALGARVRPSYETDTHKSECMDTIEIVYNE